MRRRTLISLPILLAAPLLTFAASLPSTNLEGEYIEARTADVYTGPCFANSEAGVTGDLAVLGWRINKGEYKGVALDGLSVMGVLKASNTLGDVNVQVYPVKAVLIVDSRANAGQRAALAEFARQMGGALLGDVVRVDYRPIDFTMAGNSVHSRRLCMKAGNLASVETRPLTDSDQICHNEGVYYPPLTPVDHAMPAFTIAHSYSGSALGTSWSSPDKRSAFVATFHLDQ